MEVAYVVVLGRNVGTEYLVGQRGRVNQLS